MAEDITDLYVQRNLLWRESFRLLYDSYYEQLLAEQLLARWYWVDLISRWLVAVTASGSAIAAWAVWAKEGFTIVWAIVAALSSLLSISHSVLNVGNRLKELVEDRSVFMGIRTSASSIRRKMRLNPKFDIEKMTMEVDQLSKMFSDAESKVNIQDIWRRRELEKRVQVQLNLTLKEELE
ncbi:MAG: hypothetical protein ACRC8S_16235 [Fimbriiglobus sp.]